MNAGQVNGATPAQDASAPRGEATPEQCALFERLMLAKFEAHSQTDQGQCDGEGFAMPMPNMLFGSAPALPQLAVEVPAGGPRTSQESTFTSTLAAQEIITAPVETVANSNWEVSMQEKLGVALEMRATRATGSDNKPGWTLTIGSPVVDASVLQRHVPRLNEQLRARGNTFTHVRIEGDGDEA